MEHGDIENVRVAGRNPETIVVEEICLSPNSLHLPANSKTLTEKSLTSLHFPASDINVSTATAQPEQRETRKCMSRRSGQSGVLVKQGRCCSLNYRKEMGKVLVDVTGIEPVTPCLQSRCSPS
jgi:hypothetical protein